MFYQSDAAARSCCRFEDSVAGAGGPLSRYPEDHRALPGKGIPACLPDSPLPGLQETRSGYWDGLGIPRDASANPGCKGCGPHGEAYRQAMFSKSRSPLYGAPPSDMMAENRLKEEIAMSFVGMTLSRNEIIAFGDSKPTVMLPLGTQREDERRGKIQKVFSCSDYVLATYGANQFTTARSDRMVITNIEDWLRANIPRQRDYRDLLDSLSAAIAEDTNGSISFIIGSEDDAGLYIRYAHVNRSAVTLEKKIAADATEALFSGGWSFYTNRNAEVKAAADRIFSETGDIAESLGKAVEEIITYRNYAQKTPTDAVGGG